VRCPPTHASHLSRFLDFYPNNIAVAEFSSIAHPNADETAKLTPTRIRAFLQRSHPPLHLADMCDLCFVTSFNGSRRALAGWRRWRPQRCTCTYTGVAHHVIENDGGQLVMEGCNLTGGTFGVASYGTEGTASLHDCKVHDCLAGGLVASAATTATIVTFSTIPETASSPRASTQRCHFDTRG
jgi:hypothetical protein